MSYEWLHDKFLTKKQIKYLRKSYGWLHAINIKLSKSYGWLHAINMKLSKSYEWLHASY